MMSNTKSVVMALLLAYRAQAVPVAGASPEADIQTVIDALKAQMQSLTPLASSIVEDVESKLRTDGVLSPEHIVDLDNKLHMLSPTGLLNATDIAETAVKFLDEKGAFSNPAKDSIKNKTIVLSTEMIREVLASGSIGVQDCPHKGWLCGGCVIL